MNLCQGVGALALTAMLSSTASAGALLDRFMPYTDYYAEGRQEHNPCLPQGELAPSESNEASADCSLDDSTQAVIRNLLGDSLDGGEVTMDDLADAIRDMLANGQPIDTVVDALPHFVKRHLPDLLQSRHCRFVNNGEIAVELTAENAPAQGEPYDEFVTVTVICDEVRNFRVLLTGYGGDRVQGRQSGLFYQRSAVPVKLVQGIESYPARVSFLNAGRLLSEQVFTGGFGEQDIPIVIRLHDPARMDEAPRGFGKIVGFPLSSRLILYELD